MKTIEAKQADLLDGGDRHNFGFFIDVSVDDEAIKEAYPHAVIRPTTITVLDSLDDQKEYERQKLIQQALGKLTDREREALGLAPRGMRPGG